jgi:hypothetical protein
VPAVFPPRRNSICRKLPAAAGPPARITAFITVDNPATAYAPGRCTNPVTYTRTPRSLPRLALISKFLNTCLTRRAKVSCRSA